MEAAHERIGHRWLRLVGVVGAVVVVAYQTAQAGRRDVPGKMTTVLLFIARVTRGGRERQREGEEEEERQRPGVKPSSVEQQEERQTIHDSSNRNQGLKEPVIWLVLSSEAGLRFHPAFMCQS